MIDLLIKGGRIVDGTGNPWYYGDIAVCGDRIVDTAPFEGDAKEVLDASSMVVSPGFVDLHSHLDSYILEDPSAAPKVMQGVTTEVMGNCGLSVAPVIKEDIPMLKFCLDGVLGEFDLDWNWSTIEEYLRRLESLKLGINLCYLVPHAPIRIQVIGGEGREAGTSEIEEMQEIVRSGMKSGGFGFSTGLTYHPTCFADTKELVELAAVSKEFGGLFAIHQRGWGKNMRSALNEAVVVGREADIPVELAHLFFIGEGYEFDDAIRTLQKARKEGVDITYDIQPWSNADSMLRVVLPYWVRDGEVVDEVCSRLGQRDVRDRVQRDLENSDVPYTFRDWSEFGISKVVLEKNRHLEGKTFKEVSLEIDKEPIDILCDLLIEERLETSTFFKSEAGDNLRENLQNPVSMIISDAFLFHKGNCHLIYGTFPMALGSFVRDRGLLTIEEALRKMTSAPASRLGIKDRGMLRKGMYADIVVFDPETITHTATPFEPGPPKGIAYVIVNGDVVVHDGNLTKNRPGRLIRKK